MDYLLVPRPALGLITLASAAALSAAFIGQYVFGLPPCDLCIYQRYPYLITIALCLFTLMPTIQPYAFWTFIIITLLLLINSSIGAYHVGVEQNWWTGPEGCTGPSGTPDTLEELRAQIAATPIFRCDEVAFSLFGISMAGYNVLLSSILATCAAIASKSALKV